MRIFLASLIIPFLIGCGGSDYESGSVEMYGGQDGYGPVRPSVDPETSEYLHTANSAVDAAPSATPPTTAPSIDRKIIYSADVDLIVEDFSTATGQIKELVKRFSAVVANSNVSGTTGEPRSGVWRLRIPVAEFETFLESVDDLGEVRSKSRDSQDVTEEFYDVDARIRNKKVQENGLIKILEERAGKLEDVLAVERELSRVREEIERMEGRLRLLKDLISLTTVTLRVQEVKDYVPEQSPTFGTRVGRSWETSLQSLREFGAACVVWLVGAGPWLVVLGLPMLGMAVVARRRWRKRGNQRNRGE